MAFGEFWKFFCKIPILQALPLASRLLLVTALQLEGVRSVEPQRMRRTSSSPARLLSSFGQCCASYWGVTGGQPISHSSMQFSLVSRAILVVFFGLCSLPNLGAHLLTFSKNVKKTSKNRHRRSTVMFLKRRVLTDSL
jgi:hypothetical protein